MPATVDQIDSTIDVITPENIAFEYQLAGPFRRLPAFLIDLAIRFTLLVLLQIVLFTLASTNPITFGPLILLVWFGLEWFYGGVLEAYWNGQTVGKRLMGIRVLQVDGQPINGLQAMLRNILRGMDMMPLYPVAFAGSDMNPSFYLPTGMLGVLCAVFTRRYQRMGDLACGTMVVVEEQRRLAGMVKGLDKAVTNYAEQLPPNLIVTRKISNALAAYVERRRFLAIPRVKEIAKHLGQPLAAKMGLPVPDGNYDTLLCALYYRTFIRTAGETAEEPTVTPTSPSAAPTPTVGQAAIGSTTSSTPEVPQG